MHLLKAVLSYVVTRLAEIGAEVGVEAAVPKAEIGAEGGVEVAVPKAEVVPKAGAEVEVVATV